MPWFATKSVAWRSLDADEQGLELTRIQEHSAAGTILRIDSDQNLFRVEYSIEWNNQFEIQKARIESAKGECRRLLELSRHKCWFERSAPINGSETCIDIDLWPTPLTNSFPIKRLGLNVGESRDINVLWIKAPSLEFHLAQQRYTKISCNKFRFEDRDSGFIADLKIDSDGIVCYYPQLFERLP